MDKIKIRNLEVYAYHGVYPEEKREGQNFIVSAELSVPTRKAGLSDALDDSVNYGEVCHFIDEYMRSKSFNLLEAVTENLAKELLINFEKIEQVKLEVKKPEAPIGLPFGYVSVEISRKWHKAYLGLGSNMGDKRDYILGALNLLRKEHNCIVEKVSGLFETKPYGNIEQDDFLNGCVLISTLYAPEELLDVLNEIENQAGRKRVEADKWGPRTLDIDILFYDDIIYSSEKLQIPHCDLHNRMFVLEPLKEIAPHYRHPLRRETVNQMFSNLSGELLQKRST